jgi:hypothetical protein
LRVKLLQAQLQREREQHAFNLVQAESEKAILSRELCEAPLEIALRNQRDALAACPSPIAAVAAPRPSMFGGPRMASRRRIRCEQYVSWSRNRGRRRPLPLHRFVNRYGPLGMGGMDVEIADTV